jgi:hypothetical protein
MRITHMLAVALLFLAGIFCAAIVLSSDNAAPQTDVMTTVSVSETRTAAGETVPVVTITAKKLTLAQKIASLLSDNNDSRNE